MSYSNDLRERVLNYVRQGGKKSDAVRLFGIGRNTIFRWLRQPADHRPGTPGPKASYKFDQEALRRGVDAHPERLQREWAVIFGVGKNAISLAFKRLGIVRKKRRAGTDKVWIRKGSDGVI